MERVASVELVVKFWACRIGWQRVSVGVPALPVGGKHFLRRFRIDRFKQPGAEDVERLVLFGRVERRRVSDRSLSASDISAAARSFSSLYASFGLIVLPDREGVYERNLRRRGDCLEKVMNERGNCLDASGKAGSTLRR